MASIIKILILFLLTSCSAILYFPDSYLHYHPDQFKTKFEDLKLHSIDGTRLGAWKLFSEKKPKRLVAFFHGNAQNLTGHFTTLVWMTRFESDVIIFDYRGYGVSEGKPTPKGVYEDGLSFLNYVYDDYKKGNYDQLVLYTQSLGGYVSLKVLEDFKYKDEISLYVLDSTFLAPREVAQDKTFWPLSLVITNSYTADPKLKHITMPVLSIHSKGDKVINYKLGKKLNDRILHAKSKEMWTIESEGHGDIFFFEDGKYRQKFIGYLNAL